MGNGNENRNRKLRYVQIPDQEYYAEGFITAQHLIDINYLKLKGAENNMSFPSNNFNLRLQRFPYPAYYRDQFMIILAQFLPFLVLLCFIYLGQQAAKRVAVEKENGLKEYLLMIGVSRTAIWTSHFLHHFCMLIIPAGLVTIIFCCPFIESIWVGKNWRHFGAILNHTEWSIVFILLLLYGISLINLGFMISTWFKAANAVAGSAGMLIFIFYLPYLFIMQNYANVSSGVKWGCSILSPVAMSFGFSQMFTWEGRGVGMQWKYLMEPVSSSDSTTMFGTFI